MLIDFHFHLFPDALAPRAVGKLAEIGQITPYSDGTAAGLLSKMDAWGVDRAVILNIATNAHQQDNVNAFAASLAENPRFIPFCSVHPDCPDPKGEVLRLHRLGFKGLKIHPDYIKTAIDSPRLYPIFEGAAECGMIVVTHAGYDFICPEYIHCTPDRVLRVLERYPTLKLVCAHFGGNRLWDEVLRKLCGKNVWFDTALCGFSIKPEQIKALCDNHAPDKILYGSDMPWCPIPMVNSALSAAGLSETTLENIRYKNALKLLGE